MARLGRAGGAPGGTGDAVAFDASFWLYLVHPPLVGAGSVLLFEQSLPAWVKFVASSRQPPWWG
jgi:hypothetical protein